MGRRDPRTFGRGNLILFLGFLFLSLSLLALTFWSLEIHRHEMRNLVAQRTTRMARAAAVELSRTVARQGLALRALADLGALAGPEAARDQAGYLWRGFDRGVALEVEGKRVNLIPWSEGGPPEGLTLAARNGTERPIYWLATEGGQTTLWVAVAVAEGKALALGGISDEGLGIPHLLGGLLSGPGGEAFLVDGTGRAFAATRPERVGEDLRGFPGVDPARLGQLGFTYGRDPQGRELVISYVPVAGTGWGLVVSEPWEEVASPRLRYTLLAPLTLAPVIFLALMTLGWFVAEVLRPLRRLEDGVRRWEAGEPTAIRQPVGGIGAIRHLQETLAELVEQLQEAQRGMRRYLVALTQAQEEERARLSRELHDETVQTLIALHHQAHLALRALDRDPEGARRRLQALVRTAESATAELRRLIRALRPPYLEDLGLIPTLENLLEGLPPELERSFKVEGTPRRLPSEVELTLYRVVQEALHNVVRHAGARRVEVRIAFDPDRVRVWVTDDGRGFALPRPFEALARTGHFGLLGMRERAQAVGGTLTVRSAPGRGTTVVLEVPVEGGGDGRSQDQGQVGIERGVGRVDRDVRGAEGGGPRS